MPQHILTPQQLLKDVFQVKPDVKTGNFNAAAIHCTAVIGMMGCALALIFGYALYFGDAKLRRAIITIWPVVQPTAWYILKTFPLNEGEPGPAFPFEMPWPVDIIIPALCVLALIFPGKDNVKSD